MPKYNFQLAINRRALFSSPSPGGGGSAHIERQRNVSRGGVSRENGLDVDPPGGSEEITRQHDAA
jgi:hypothetical protein